MELNEITSVGELLWKFMPHTNIYKTLKNKTTNDKQSKKRLIYINILTYIG